MTSQTALVILFTITVHSLTCSHDSTAESSNEIILSRETCDRCEQLFGPVEISTATPASNACTCPSVDVTTCTVPHNTKYAAANLEEAIVNFPDLSVATTETVTSTTSSPEYTSPPQLNGVQDVAIMVGPMGHSRPGFPMIDPLSGSPPSFPPPPLPRRGGGRPPPPSPPNGKCNTDECRACRNQLINRLDSIRLLEKFNKSALCDHLGISQNIPTDAQCTRYAFAMDPGPYGPEPFTKTASSIPSDTMINDIAYKMMYGRPPPPDILPPQGSNGENCWQWGPGPTSREPEQTEGDHFHHHGKGKGKNRGRIDRGRRQANATKTLDEFVIAEPALGIKRKDLGTRYKISCVKRGEPTSTGASWVSLCDYCWVWRELPSGYFPQYLNELTCVQNTTCLAGYGKCNEFTRSIDVLPDKTNVTRVETIEVSVGCNCQVGVGWAFQNFVRT